MLLLAVFFTNLACWMGFKTVNKRAQKNAELRQWAPFKQNPAVDNLLRRHAGEIQDPRKRWAADRIKNTTRNFVNSESFSIAVDGLVNQQSQFWKTGRSASNFFKGRRAQEGDLQPLVEAKLTIQ